MKLLDLLGSQTLALASVQVFGFVLTIAVVWILWKAQRAPRKVNPFDAAQMFQDDQDRTSLAKFLALVGGITSIWVIVYLAVKDKLDSVMFVGWLTVLVLGKVAQSYVDKNGPNNPPPAQ